MEQAERVSFRTVAHPLSRFGRTVVYNAVPAQKLLGMRREQSFGRIDLIAHIYSLVLRCTEQYARRVFAGFVCCSENVL